MKYIKYFETEAERQAFTENYRYFCYVEESQGMGIHYYDYSQDYLTLVARASGTFKFVGEGDNAIQYSTDDGGTWSAAAQTVEINVNTGDKVLWKGQMTPYADYRNGVGKFNASTAEFDIQGNIMSLLYGDSFTGQTDLTGKKNTFSYLF